MRLLPMYENPTPSGFMLCGSASLSFNIFSFHLRKIWHQAHCSTLRPDIHDSFSVSVAQRSNVQSNTTACSFLSVFSLPHVWTARPLLPLPHSGHLRAFRHGGHFHKRDTLRTRYLVGLSTILHHCTLFFFFTASLTMYNYVSAGLFYHHLPLPPICMFHEDRGHVNFIYYHSPST